MRALCWHGRNDVRVDTVPDPTLLNPRDAIVRITSTAICGSDLHLYDGYIPSMREGEGQTHVHRYLRPLLELIQREAIDPSFVITHRMALEQAPHGYEIFKRKEQGCVKVVLSP